MLILPSKTTLSAAARKKSGGGGPADPYFANVSLLLHMNGTNNSTTFTDSSSNALVMTAQDNAKISTAQSKFGGASGLFDGSADCVTTPSNAALNFGTGDFTIEMWVYPTFVGTTEYEKGFISTTGGSPTTGFVFGYTPNLFRLGYINDAGHSIAAGTLTANVWQHLALTRSSGSVRFFKDGIQMGSTSANTRSYDLSLGGTRIASWQTYSYAFFPGYIDELRVTKGVGRYTTNFTPQTAQFPDY